MEPHDFWNTIALCQSAFLNWSGYFITIPLLFVALSFLLKSRSIRIVGPAMLWAHALVVGWRLRPVLNGTIERITFDADFSADRIAALFIILTISVVASALTQAIWYFGAHSGESTHANEQVFYASASVFLLAMTFVFLSNNLGFLWICVEGTTLFSAPLVYFDRTKNAVEATWKYLIICSVGIAFALLGTILIFASSQYAGASVATLRIDELIQNAGRMDATLLKLGFVFCLLGYGTKAGVFPLHNWLPDAHSEAPAPASAILSGSLLNCALFAIYKIFQIVHATPSIEPAMQKLVLYLGAVTTVAASLLLIRQHSFKRIWAYSSIENVGIMLMCISFGSGALFLFQAVNHSLSKVALFLLSGNIIQASKTKRLSGLHGLLEAQPLWAVLLALAACAATGCPPFGAFVSELKALMLTANAQNWPSAIMLLLGISISFVAISSHLGHVLCGSAKSDFHADSPVRTSIVPTILVVSSLLLGIFIPFQFWSAIK